jgi:hypothetical protein
MHFRHLRQRSPATFRVLLTLSALLLVTGLAVMLYLR